MVAVADLVEAEGRALRRSTLRTGAGLVLLLMAGMVLLGGIGLSLWGGYQWLSVIMGGVGAKVLIGLLMMVVAGGFTWVAIRINR